MKLVIQRVSEARVTVNQETVGAIRTGLVALIGISKLDTESDAEYLVDKLHGIRIFADETGKMYRNISDANGAHFS